MSIIDLAEAGEIDLFPSDALAFETQRNPHPTRQQFGFEVMNEASKHVALSEAIEARAQTFNQAGIKPFDALHLASAVEAGAHYFCTCDDSFLNKAKRQDTGGTTVVDPLELAVEIEQWHPDKTAK